ncbi:OLC1v1031284C1 [Oldenlandia corymbosa var. corymbosa]|uniref:Ubiquitin carboxyl-terminal hydrolase n=1 Tax=Oldenlandia corymbosa var. corymbosa TaxID=529605 RepID=A0AAV1CI57_OLDCO|nr:OLC1v1031284C1 [Oldenlandia corymbosa var. corymbosa]
MEEAHQPKPLQTHSPWQLNSLDSTRVSGSDSGSSVLIDKTLSSSEDFDENLSPVSEETVPYHDPSDCGTVPADSDGRDDDDDEEEEEIEEDYYLNYCPPLHTAYSSCHWAEPWNYSSYLRSSWSPWSPSPCSRLGLGSMDDSRSSEDDSALTGWRSSTELEMKTPFSSLVIEQKPSIMGAGLANMGNTCFLNVILQCFTHTVPLLQGLLERTHKVPCERFCEGFCVFCNLFDHIERALRNPGGIISPYKFVNNLNYFSSSFRRYQQEDAHEFLQCFLDKLESCDTYSKPPESDDIVKMVFGGRLVSQLRCCNCGHRSDTYEPFVNISLEIDEVSTLSTALKSFTKVEKLEAPETKFICDHCKEQVSVEKQLMLDQAPSVATFQLKRFKNDGSFVEKIDNHVAFPLELDLQPYAADNQSDKQVEMTYDLYAVVVHTGFSSTSGHYFCFVRASPDEWYRFDDSKVYVAEQEQVLEQEAYILFYVKQGTPCFSSFVETHKKLMELGVLNTSPKSVLDILDDCKSPDLQRSCHFDGKEVAVEEETPGGRDSRVVDDSDEADNSISTVPLVSCNSSVMASHDISESAFVSCVNNSSDVHSCKAGESNSPVANHPDVPCEVNTSSSLPVLRESDSGQEPPELGNTAALPSIPLRSSSPEIYREDPSEKSFTLPRGHLRLMGGVSCKRQLNKELEEGRKQAVTIVKRNIVGGSRKKQLTAAICATSSEVSASKKRSRGTHMPAGSDDRSSASRRRGNMPVLASSLR